MSQQQLVPEPQDGSEHGGNEEIYQQYYKVAKSKSGGVPKDEHPSTFEASIPPYSYRAQDTATHAYNSADPAYTAHPHEIDARARQYRRQRFSPDGDALENGYRPYQQQQRMQYQVPSWARPQQHNGPHVLRWLVLIVLGIVFIKLVLVLIGALFLVGLGVLAFIILIPLIVIGALLVAGVVLGILGIVLGRAVWRSGWRW
jgi:hypothetical protein